MRHVRHGLPYYWIVPPGCEQQIKDYAKGYIGTVIFRKECGRYPPKRTELLLRTPVIAHPRYHDIVVGARLRALWRMKP